MCNPCNPGVQMFSLLLACATPETKSTPVDTLSLVVVAADTADTADDIDLQVGYTVAFDSDSDSATLTCGGGTYTVAFDDDGYAAFDVECTTTPYFNVTDNSNPDVLA